jgi:hypothetical protein
VIASDLVFSRQYLDLCEIHFVVIVAVSWPASTGQLAAVSRKTRSLATIGMLTDEDADVPEFRKVQTIRQRIQQDLDGWGSSKPLLDWTLGGKLTGLSHEDM